MSEALKAFGLPELDIKKTCAEWNESGFRVRKGERATQKNESGIALFSADQVWLPRRSRGRRPSPFYNTSPDEADYEGEDSDDFDMGMDYSDFGNN